MSNTKVSKVFYKRVADVQDYDVDFSLYLQGLGDAATAHVVTAPVGITLGVSTLDTLNGRVKVWLSGGTGGERYVVLTSIDTLGGRTKEIAFAIQVLP